MNTDQSLAAFALSWQVSERASLLGRLSDLHRAGTIIRTVDHEALGAEVSLVIDSAVGSLAGECSRYIYARQIRHRFPNVGECSPRLILTVNEETGTAVVWLNLDLGPGDHVDDLIGLSHSLFGTPSSSDGFVLECGDLVAESIRELLLCVMIDISGEALSSDQAVHDFRLFEFRGGSCHFPPETGTDHGDCTSQEIYGLLTGDEGWRHVPNSRAHRIVDDFWSSRHFLQVAAMGTCVVMMNTKDSEYKSNARKFFSTYFQAYREYFDMNFTIAGLDSGVMFACEIALERMIGAEEIIKDIRAEQRKRSRVATGSRFPQSRLFLREVISGRLQSARLRVREYVAQIRDTGIVEVNDMLNLIIHKSGVSELEKSVEDLSDMMDSDIDRVGAFELARLIMLGTVASVVLAVTSIVVVVGHL